MRWSSSASLIQVHPYDDARIIAGQGTVALEMLEDEPDLDCLVIPIGGGGLISGNAIAAKAIKPDIEIFGVEAALYPAMWNALRGESKPTGGPTLAEGIAVKIGRRADRADREIARVRNLSGRGAASRAGGQRLSDIAENHGGGRRRGRPCGDARKSRALCAAARRPACSRGGNIDPRILASIMVRELERDDQIVSFRLTIAGPAGRARTDRDTARGTRRQHPRSRSQAAVSGCAGQGHTPRRHGRDARQRACR